MNQCNSSHQGDWVRQVDIDRKNIELNLDNLEISKMSKTKFKTIVHDKEAKHRMKELIFKKQFNETLCRICHLFSETNFLQRYLKIP